MPHATIALDTRFTVGTVERRLFGAFVEHLGRCVYDGLYEPGHSSANADGFRTDVMELVRELGATTIRYPGGNFVSGYRWEDGIGARQDRPKRLDLAWHSIETNEVGLDEFARWNEQVGAELMLAVNLGTRGVAEALDLLEYTNISDGTTLSERRIANGRKNPYNVRMWCLGNEMDGDWQLGHSTADEYGTLAAKVAKAMRQIDPGLELVVCGSSSAHMPTFGTWERVVLEHCYDDVDFISCHAYYEEKEGDLASFLASATDMDGFIESVTATADSVRAGLKRTKRINISFDEWNVWYLERSQQKASEVGPTDWPRAPRLLEDQYSVADAVVVGSLLISLLKHADRVRSASLAQLVNVIAPIMTEPGGPSWRQTTFFPFALTARMARGTALALRIDSDTYTTDQYGIVSVVDAVATYDEATSSTSIFLVNRAIDAPTTVQINVAQLGDVRIEENHQLSDSDVYAKNTLSEPERVKTRRNDTANIVGGVLTIELPAVSWCALRIVEN